MSELTAYHEAGHALMALMLGGEVRLVTIEPDHDDGPARSGDTQVLWRSGGSGEQEFAAKAVQVCLAGPVAEMIYSGEPFHPGLVPEWAGDWRDAWQAAARLHPGERLRLQFLERTSARLHRLLRRDPHWSALAELADNLLAHETLEWEQVAEIVAPWLA
jgi:ATP-dependent Zn protease